MPTTYLTDALAKLRQDLQDEDSADYRWTTARLQRAVAKALRAYSAACPLTATATINAVDGQRDYSLAAVTAVVNRPEAILRAEYHYNSTDPTYPTPWRNFEVHDGVLRILDEDAPASGDVIRLYYTTEHTFTDATRTFAPEDEDLLLEGAAAYAMQAYARYTVNRITTDGTAYNDAAEQAKNDLAAWQKKLDARANNTAAADYRPTAWPTDEI